MLCKNCNKEIISDSKFCQYCGEKIVTENSSDNKSKENIDDFDNYSWFKYSAYINKDNSLNKIDKIMPIISIILVMIAPIFWLVPLIYALIIRKNHVRKIYKKSILIISGIVAIISLLNINS